MLIAVVGATSASHAYRAEIIALHAGRRVEGAEVCLFRGAAGNPDPFAVFVQSNELTCLPADMVIDVPPGLWHLFARHSRGFISTNPAMLSYDGPPIPERYYKALETDIYPAAMVEFPTARDLPPDQFIVAYYPHTNVASPPAFQPLPRGDTSMLIRAGTPVLPMIVRKGEPVLIGATLIVKPGERVTYRFESRRGVHDVVTWVFPSKDFGINQIGSIRESPTVEYTAEGGQTYAPLFSLGFPAFTEFALQIFRVPPGPGKLTLHGRYWRGRMMEVKDSAEPVHIPGPGFALEPAGAIRLAWSIPDGADSHASAKCGELSKKTSIRMRLHRCPERQAAINEDCVTVASKTVNTDSTSGTLDLTAVAPGEYLLSTTLLMGTVDVGAPIVAPVSVLPGRDSNTVAAFSIRSVVGRVTRRGTPLEGIIEFPDGATKTDADGRYRIFLSRDQPPARVTIIQCEPKRMFTTIARGGIVLGTDFDIDLPDSELHVRVVDTVSKQPLQAAQVHYALMKSEDSREAWGISAVEVTGDRGDVSFLSIPTDEWLIVCSRREGYKPSCSGALKLNGHRRQVVLPLSRTSWRGRLVASPVPRGGRIIWMNGLGDVTEEVLVEADGTFSFDRPHAANEHLILVSQDQPLYVLQSPSATDDGFTITLPRVNPRDITVRYAGEAQGVARVKIAGVIVPSDVLVAHQNLRWLGWTVSSQAPLRIPQIADVGPIEVAVVPESVFNQDPAAFEQLARGFAFKPVPRDGVVRIP